MLSIASGIMIYAQTPLRGLRFGSPDAGMSDLHNISMRRVTAAKAVIIGMETDHPDWKCWTDVEMIFLGLHSRANGVMVCRRACLFKL